MRAGITECLSILPYDVRYAIRYRRGILNKDDINSMTAEGFNAESVYLIGKAFSQEPIRQQWFLEQVVDFSLQEKSQTGQFRNFLQDCAEVLDSATEVRGHKLARISNTGGFDCWQVKFKDLADGLAKDGVIPVLLAHSMLLGLSRFIEAYRDTSIPIFLIDPNKVEDTDNVGYVINLDRVTGERVQLLSSGFGRPDRAVLIDDTKQYGRHIERVREFWRESIGERIVYFCPEAL